jgi:hypothetical protein
VDAGEALGRVVVEGAADGQALLILREGKQGFTVELELTHQIPPAPSHLGGIQLEIGTGTLPPANTCSEAASIPIY